MHHQEFITKSAEEILLDETELLTTTSTRSKMECRFVLNNGSEYDIPNSILCGQLQQQLNSSELGGKENQSGRIRVILNEGSTAGILEPMNGCTRLLMTEEGNVVLTRIGAFLLTATRIRKPNVLEDCRA
ncbi:unnamed protein product [Adineta steineri]|uniref:Uncharacterized protein n=1 Tax=Adineta steineri TaxID=433720 RepID=A0A814NQR9_9BILA|nr:unnamed protein product [Adineta steineri]CAF1339502.1 unnamed protein product [Adineta steineri]CAF1348343.1 unnamed protein product [Adineta steineri]